MATLAYILISGSFFWVRVGSKRGSGFCMLHAYIGGSIGHEVGSELCASSDDQIRLLLKDRGRARKCSRAGVLRTLHVLCSALPGIREYLLHPLSLEDLRRTAEAALQRRWAEVGLIQGAETDLLQKQICSQPKKNTRQEEGCASCLCCVSLCVCVCHGICGER